MNFLKTLQNFIKDFEKLVKKVNIPFVEVTSRNYKIYFSISESCGYLIKPSLVKRLNLKLSQGCAELVGWECEVTTENEIIISPSVKYIRGIELLSFKRYNLKDVLKTFKSFT